MIVSGWLYLLEQTGVGFCLLTAIGLCAGCRLSYLHIALSALLGALTALATASSPLWLRLTAWGLVCLAGPMLAFPGLPRSLRLRTVLCTLLLSLTCAGLMRLMHPLPLPSAAMVLLGCGALRSLPLLLPKPQELPHLATVDIRCGAHHVALTALIDSGNLLRDAVSGLPVIVISRRAAMRLVSLPPAGALSPGMRLLPVRTISGMAMMPIFRPDCVCLLQQGVWQNVPAIIGVSPDGYDGFQALVPSCLLPAAPSPAVPNAIHQSEC